MRAVGFELLAKILAKIAKSEAFVGSAHSAETIKRKARERKFKELIAIAKDRPKWRQQTHSKPKL